jgi:hypothetical protein
VTKLITVDGMHLPASADAVAEKKLVQQLDGFHAHANDLVEKYALALPVGGKQLKNTMHTLTGSFAVRFISAIEANAHLPIPHRKTLTELADLANALHLEKPCDEKVSVAAFPKSKGGFRPVCNFGIRHRTAQQVARLMLGKIVKPQPWQYDWRGVDRVIERLQTAFSAGQNYAIHLDIQNFYGSFDHKALREALPLPKRMIDHYLVGRKLKYAPWGTSHLSHGVLLKAALKGAPQGSSATPMIGVHTISNIPWKPSPDMSVAGYVDDFALTGCSEQQVEADAKALCAAVAALPSGTFSLKAGPIVHVSQGFDFLGVRFKRTPQLKIETAPGKALHFLKTLRDMFEDAFETVIDAKESKSDSDLLVALGMIARLWRYGKSWLWTYRMCADVPDLKPIPEEHVGELLLVLGSNMGELNEYMSASKEGAEYGYPE